MYEGQSKSFEPEHTRLQFFHILYISKTCILYRLLRVCCGYDVIVIYDITEH